MSVTQPPHTSKDYDQQLGEAHALVLQMGARVERIGDHAKNIAEHAIYAVKGADVRHATVAEIEQELRG